MRSNTEERAAAEETERTAELIAAGATAHAPAAKPAAGEAGETLDLSHLMERPEVQSAIADATARAVAAVLAKMQAEAGPVAAPLASAAAALSDRSLVEALALAIGEMNDQGRPNARRTVAPAVLAARNAARDAMVTAILRARAMGHVPEYALTASVYLSETWIKATWIASDHVERARRIKWPGVPNQAMRPMDAIAHEIYGHFCDSIGASASPQAKDPLTQGFKILNTDGQPPETGQGQGATGPDAVQIGGRAPQDALIQPIHILGTVAEPARPVTYNG